MLIFFSSPAGGSPTAGVVRVGTAFAAVWARSGAGTLSTAGVVALAIDGGIVASVLARMSAGVVKGLGGSALAITVGAEPPLVSVGVAWELGPGETLGEALAWTGAAGLIVLGAGD